MPSGIKQEVLIVTMLRMWERTDPGWQIPSRGPQQQWLASNSDGLLLLGNSCLWRNLDSIDTVCILKTGMIWFSSCRESGMSTRLSLLCIAWWAMTWSYAILGSPNTGDLASRIRCLCSGMGRVVNLAARRWTISTPCLSSLVCGFQIVKQYSICGLTRVVVGCLLVMFFAAWS